MKKKTLKVKKAKKEAIVEEKVLIAPITADFGREDLHLFRDKINEVIARLNA